MERHSSEFTIFTPEEYEIISSELPCKRGCGYVYIIEIDNEVKIGQSVNPSHRLYEIRHMLEGYGHRVLGRIAISPIHVNFAETEKKLHNHFQKHRIESTELFTLTFDTVMKSLPSIELLKDLDEDYLHFDLWSLKDEFFSVGNIEAVKAWIDHRMEILNATKEILAANDDYLYTIPIMAQLYNVPNDTIRTIIKTHEDEVCKWGCQKYSVHDLEFLKMKYGKSIQEIQDNRGGKTIIMNNGKHVYIKNDGGIVLSARAVKGCAYYIKNEIAQEIVDYLIDIGSNGCGKENRDCLNDILKEYERTQYLTQRIYRAMKHKDINTMFWAITDLMTGMIVYRDDIEGGE